MKLNYKDNTGFVAEGGWVMIEVGSDTDREDNGVYLSIHPTDLTKSGATTTLNGEDQIKAFLYQVAYDGGLIDEDGEITISKPKPPKVVPADGVYVVNNFSEKFYAVVVDGRVLVPQVDHEDNPLNGGQVIDQTNSYLTNDKFELVPVKVTGRRE